MADYELIMVLIHIAMLVIAVVVTVKDKKQPPNLREKLTVIF